MITVLFWTIWSLRQPYELACGTRAAIGIMCFQAPSALNCLQLTVSRWLQVFCNGQLPRMTYQQQHQTHQPLQALQPPHQWRPAHHTAQQPLFLRRRTLQQALEQRP